jgi:biopolymer transport protein TolR
MSATQRRQSRQKQRKAQVAQLSLTSLMDIFTILVFFLLVSAQNPVQLPSLKDLTLPTSSTSNLADNSLKLVINQQQILINDQPIMQLNANGAENDFTPLATALANQQGNYKPQQIVNGQGERNVIIMGDQQLPYSTLRQIMKICSQQQFGRVSFAVLREKKANA